LTALLLNEMQKQNRESQTQSTELQQQRDELRTRAAENQQQAAQIRKLFAKVAELQVNHERELRTLEASFEQRLSALEQANHTGALQRATLMP
jgi:hypothetical protein